MAKQENGHWITYQGRRIFISDDPVEKQEREIKEREESTKKMTAEKREEKTDGLPFTSAQFNSLSTEMLHCTGKRMSLADIQKKLNEWGYKEGLGTDASKNFDIKGYYITKYGSDGEVEDAIPWEEAGFDFEDKDNVWIITAPYWSTQGNEIGVYFGEPDYSPDDEWWDSLSASAKRYYMYED